MNRKEWLDWIVGLSAIYSIVGVGFLGLNGWIFLIPTLPFLLTLGYLGIIIWLYIIKFIIDLILKILTALGNSIGLDLTNEKGK